MRQATPNLVYPVVSTVGDTPYVLTQTGRLMAFLTTNARDPDGRDDAAFLAATLTLENALSALPADAHVQQWLWHGPATLPTLRPRPLRVSQRVGEARMAHLSRRPLYQTRLLTAISLDTKALAGNSNWIDLVNGILTATVDRAARRELLRNLHITSSMRVLRSAVDQCAERLRDAIAQYIARLSIHQDHRVLDAESAWHWCQALAQLDSRAFSLTNRAPATHWYASLARAPIHAQRFDGIDMLRSQGADSFGRIGTITRLHDYTAPAFWAVGSKPIIGIDGNFILALNAAPLSPIAAAMQFKRAQNQIDQAKLSVIGLMLRAAGKPTTSERNPILEEQERELTAAQGQGSRWWHVNTYVCAFGQSAREVIDTSLSLDTALANANVGVTWESPIHIDAFTAMQPGARPLSPRAHLLNSTQVGAIALNWSHSQGDATVADLGDEEPLLFLETRDRQLYGFNPFVGEKSTVIVVGPTRSGKTFAKNAMLAHFPKYDGARLVAIDFDPGSECLASLYGDEAALVRGRQGLNPFTARHAPGFSAHFSRLVQSMLAANDESALATFAEGEQLELDAALQATLALPESLQILASFVHHLSPRLRQKFSRWVRDGDGRYADLLDADTDHVGLIDRAVTVFNLTHLRDDPKARGPVVNELLYRITAAFEDPRRRGTPKTLTLDEVHLFLKDRIAAQFVEDKARTVAKWMGSMWLMTQQPHELLAIDNWPAIRTAASTFLFTAAPELDAAVYKAAFGLTPEDIRTIERLTPKAELYLVQPDTGVRKVLRLDPDNDTLQWASSTARVVAERERRAVTEPLTEGA